MSGEARGPIHEAASDSGLTWRVGPDGIAEVLLDTPAEKVNLLDLRTLAALEEAVSFLGRRPGLRGALIASAKPGVFIAGADVKLIASVRTPEQARAATTAGQMVFAKLEGLPFPTAAAISGACLGGGLELALACTLRVAADAEEVQVGLPEVRLGLVPGWGGTQRLPPLVGLPAALDLILTGRTLSAREALRAGLVDAVAPPERLLAEARRRLREAAARRPARRLPVLQRLHLAPPARGVILARARAAARRAAGGRYPAPPAAVDAVRAGLALGRDEGLRRETDHVAALVVGEVSRNLVRIFLAKRTSGAAEGPPPRTIRRIGILGAGVMGGAIAAVAASKGLSVRLRDVAPEPLERGLASARGILAGRGRRRASEAEALVRFMKIEPALRLDGLGRADLVLEAVVEDLAVKRRVLAEAEAAAPEDAILASNTSSLPIDALAEGLREPERLLGLHFFNPADRMPLVEVVRGRRSEPGAVAAAEAFVRKIGKTPVLVADAPGFLVNRLLMPYLAEALRGLAEGAPIDEIDRTLTRFGMPMGPLALLDRIGIDVAARVARILKDAFGARVPDPAGLEALARAGLLGVKSGRGFYVHGRGRPRPNPEAVPLAGGGRRGVGGPAAPRGEALVRRLLHPVVNEAALALDEGVAASPGAVDLAMVLGTGFPPFLGGPLRWADREGVAAVAASLREMSARHGAHLAPCGPLERIARGRGRFHPD